MFIVWAQQFLGTGYGIWDRAVLGGLVLAVCLVASGSCGGVKFGEIVM